MDVLDFIFVGATVGFFALCLLYIVFCDFIGRQFQASKPTELDNGSEV